MKKSPIWFDFTKGLIFSERYWYYFNCPKNVLCSTLSFVFWIFSPSDTALQLESADSKQNPNSKSLFQDSFMAHFMGNEKNVSYFLKKKRPLGNVEMIGRFVFKFCGLLRVSELYNKTLSLQLLRAMQTRLEANSKQCH